MSTVQELLTLGADPNNVDEVNIVVDFLLLHQTIYDRRINYLEVSGMYM